MHRLLLVLITCLTLLAPKSYAASNSYAALDHSMQTFCMFVANSVYDQKISVYDLERGQYENFKWPKLEVGIESHDGSFRSASVSPLVIVDITKILVSLSNGKYEDAGKQGAETFIGITMPLVGQYMGLLKAATITADSLIANWTEDLYHTKAYTHLLDLVNETFLENAQKGTPYLPSFWVSDPVLRKRMQQVETLLHGKWIENNDVKVDVESDYFISRINFERKKQHTDEEVFNHFLKKIADQQKGYFLTNFNRLMKKEALRAQKEFKKRSKQAVQNYFNKNSLPKKLKLSAQPCTTGTGLCINYGADLTPTINYNFSFYLEKNQEPFSQADVQKIKTDKLKHNGSLVMNAPSDLSGYQLVMIVQNQFGRSESMTVDFKKTTMHDFSIKGTHETYDGKPIKGSVQNGQILAFSASVKHAKRPKKVVTTIHWQLTDENGKPVEGIEKKEQTFESGGTKQYGFRFIPDNLSDGKYKVRLTHFETNNPDKRKTKEYPFTISQTMKITKLVVTPDKEKQNNHKIIYTDQTPLLYAHYALNSGIDNVTATLSAKNRNTGQVLDSITTERPLKGDSQKQRVGLMLDKSLIKPADKIDFQVTLVAPDGKTFTKTTTFSVKDYRLSFRVPALTAGKSKYMKVSVPSSFSPPYKVRYNSGDGLNIIESRPLTLKLFGTRSDSNGKLTVSVTDSTGKKASGTASYWVFAPEEKKPVEPVASAPKKSGNQNSWSNSAPSFSGINKTQSGSGKSSVNSSQLGKQRFNQLTSKVMATYPTCFPEDIKKTIKQTLVSGGKNHYNSIGRMSQSQWNNKLKKDLASTGKYLSGLLAGMIHDPCLEQLSKNLMSKGWISYSDHNKSVQAMKKNKEIKSGPSKSDCNYYAVLSWYAYKGKRVCKVQRGKPKTGLFDPVQYDPYGKGMRTGHKRWIIAFGPDTKNAVTKFSNLVNNKSTNFNGYWVPWLPTSNGKLWDMPQKEYITKQGLSRECR